MKMILAMLPTIVLVVYGQLVTKWRVAAMAGALDESAGRSDRLLAYLSDPYILSSYVAALAGSAGWMFVVERYDISIAFPVYVGLTVCVVAIGGALLFSETITASKWIAIALIIGGVIIGSRE